MIFAPNKRKIISNLKINNRKLKTVQSTKYLGVTIDNNLCWKNHVDDQTSKCTQLLFNFLQKTKTYFGPKPKLMRWVYTGIIRPKLSYAAIVWAHSITAKQHKKLRKLNRTACMSLTPTTRSTPQASLEIIYNIKPIDLYLNEVGLKAYLRLRSQLDTPWDCKNINPHLGFWHNLKLNYHSLLQPDDRCNELEWFKQYKVNMESFSGSKKFITPSEVTVYTDGSKTENGVGSGFVVYHKNKRIQVKSTRISDLSLIHI